MDTFLILQILFDAILLFGVLFVFHFSFHQSDKKKEEADIFKNIQAQEIKENLQELLITLKQLGKEVSENIQERVREAEEKTDLFKNTIQKLQKDLKKVIELAAEVDSEKNHLQEKIKAIKTGKEKSSVTSLIKDAVFSSASITDGGEEDVDGKIGIVPKKSGVLNVRASSAAIEVYRLADQELNINEIVQRTRLSRAEVQLILNLRGNRFTTPN